MAALRSAGYLPTPSGNWLHQSCIHQVDNGAQVDGDGITVRSQDGKTVKQYAPCMYKAVPTNSSNPGATTSLSPAPADFGSGNGNSWMEAAYVQKTYNRYNWFNALSSQFNVPAAPTNQHGQVIYLFPSLNIQVPGLRYQDKIVQPVLEWGQALPNGSGTGPYWTITSVYYDGATDHEYYSPPLPVSPGDTIYGWAEMIALNPPWDMWEIFTQDLNTGNWTQVTVNTQAKFTYAEIGTMEVYAGVADCSWLPASSPVNFSTSYWMPLNSWNTYYGPCVWPQTYIQPGLPGCGFGVTAYSCRGALLNY